MINIKDPGKAEAFSIKDKHFTHMHYIKLQHDTCSPEQVWNLIIGSILITKLRDKKAFSGLLSKTLTSARWTPPETNYYPSNDNNSIFSTNYTIDAVEDVELF